MDERRARKSWMWAAGFLGAVVGLFFACGSALAQGLPIETTPGPAKALIRLEPNRPGETTARLPEAAYPRDIGVRLNPAFVEPLAARYETKSAGPVRLGFAGWTSPNVPVVGAKSGAAEVNGWLSLGFALTWGNRR
jgi:hypothetical protein